MKTVAVVAFLGGLLLWVRVMFFGVRRQLEGDRVAHRRWPLAAAAFLAVGGAALYVAADRSADSIGEGGVTGTALALVVLGALLASGGAAWLVQKSAAVPSSDPEDDPRYRFQGHVARVTEAIDGRSGVGRVSFEFEGRRHELSAIWAVSDDARPQSGDGARGQMGSEVVIERVEGDVAYVEPWTSVEERL